MKTRYNSIFRHTALVSAFVLSGPAALAADILWSGSLTGTLNWNTGSNWNGGAFVNSINDRADFRVNWATTPTINLSEPVTVNGIIFDDAGTSGDSSLTLANGGTAGNTLTLGGVNPSVEVLTTTLTISANLAGNAGFTKSGSGILVLSGSNTAFSGPVIVGSGTLRLANNDALGSGSVVQINSGATLNVNNTNTVAGLNGNLGSGGSITNASGGGKTLTVAGSDTYSFSGNFTTGGSNKIGLLLSGSGTQTLGGANTVNTGYQSITGGGTLVFAKQNSIFQGLAAGAVVNNGQAANAGISVSNGSAVALGVGDSASGYFDATAIATFLDSSHMGASTNSTGFRNDSILGFDTTNATAGSFTYSAALGNIGSSTGIGFAKLGTGTLVLTASNTYGGVTQVRTGTLQLGDGGTSGSIGSSGNVVVSNGATLALNRSDTVTFSNRITGGGGFSQTGAGQTNLESLSNDFSGPISISGGILQAKSLGNGTLTLSSTARQFKIGANTTFNNSIVINGATGVANQGVIDTDTATHAVFTGPITINGTPTNGGHFGSSSAGSLAVSGVITSAAPVVFRRGTGIFSGGGTGYTTLQIRAGTVRLGGTNGLATTATVAIGGDGSAAFDLAGYNQSLVGITKGANSAALTNSGSNHASLTLTGTSIYAGVIQDGATHKTGLNIASGVSTLSGVNTYTGSTHVNGGTLVVNGSLGNTSTTVASGGTLRGSGSLGGAVHIQGGGTLTAGNHLQGLATGALTFDALSSFTYRIDNPANSLTAAGFVAVNGGLTLDLGTAATMTLVEANSGTWSVGSKIALISYTGSWNGGLFDYGETLADDSTFSFGGANWLFNYNDTSADSEAGPFSGTRYVTMTAIPEPEAALVGSLGLLMLLRRRR